MFCCIPIPVSAQDESFAAFSVAESFAGVQALNEWLAVATFKEEAFTPEKIKRVGGWRSFTDEYDEREEERLVVRLALNYQGKQPLATVLYLHDLPRVAGYHYVDTEEWTAFSAGRLTKREDRSLYQGFVLPGKGYSTQVPILLQPGRNEIYLEVEYLVREPFRPALKLFEQRFWEKQINQEFERSIGWHLLVLGGLFIMAIYHLLIFLQRRDYAFFWYAMYTLVVAAMIMIESGVMQLYVTAAFPTLNLLYRTILPHALLGYLTYWLFLRSFIGMKVVLPKADRMLKWLLIGTTIIVVSTAAAFIWGLKSGQYLNLKPLAYFVPIICLLAGIVFYFVIIRLGDRLVNLLLLGSLVLLAGLFTNLVLSLGGYYGWWKDLPFPHFYISEIAVLIEVVVFALVLGLRSQQAEYERSRAEQLNELNARFFANISHEFRTPLTVIAGMADEVEGNEQQVKLIKRNGKSLLQLVNQLLDLSKLDAGLLTTKRHTGDLLSYLNYLTESYYSLAREKDLRLSFYTEEPGLIMDFDEVQLQQIVRNLLSNAIKFTPAGGTVIMHARVVAEKNDPWLQLVVKDTGIGISPAEQAHVFDRFYQVNAASTREGQGTGIGLALTKELVELAGGTIVVESQLGKWTAFTIKLPIRTTGEVKPVVNTPAFDPMLASQASAFTQTSAPLPDTADHLLIIDDNPDIVSYLQHLLAGSYQITVAKNGQAGIDAAYEIIPDIIISDVMMPVKDGYEVCTALKGDQRTSHIPIILLTAKAGEQDRVTGLAGGADAFLTKPFNKKELFIRLEQLVDLRKKLQQRYQGFTVPGGVASDENEQQAKVTDQERDDQLVLDLEDQFLRKIVRLIERRMDDPQLVVGDLAKEVRLSNMQVNRKLKALTGKTGNALVRAIRLQRAKQLLLEGEMNVSEVAYTVGFNDPNYFSRAFSTEFGMTPSRFLNS